MSENEADCAEEIYEFSMKLASVFLNEPITEEDVLNAIGNLPHREPAMTTIDIDEAAVLAAVTKLKSSASPGPDGIPSSLLKKCSAYLMSPLSHLFRLSLRSGKFPDTWKWAFMFPVHKKGDLTDVNNYRGISALCGTFKLFELVVIEPILSRIGKILLADEQHGFLLKQSTATNLLCFTKSIIESFDNFSQTDALYTDLSAAFDKFNHRIAVAKLEKFFPPNQLQR